MNWQIIPYNESLEKEWNSVVDQSRQGTFLFNRAYMDYHADRFRDESLVVTDDKGRTFALFPACRMPGKESAVSSHAGLTYGGMLTLSQVSAEAMLEMFQSITHYYAMQGFTTLHYKPIPYIYHQYPSEEDLYALFRLGAQLESRAISSVIDLLAPYPFSELRRRKVRKAEKTSSLLYVEGTDHLETFWHVLDDVLTTRHNVHPVHTLDEIRLLISRFPENIKLCTACMADHPEHVIAGCLLFITKSVCHVQYIASGDDGRNCGALDWLFARVVGEIRKAYPQIRYFDFGISTERGGTFLNQGLIFQKEGFGGRGVCYDSYQIPLSKN